MKGLEILWRSFIHSRGSFVQEFQTWADSRIFVKLALLSNLLSLQELAMDLRNILTSNFKYRNWWWRIESRWKFFQVWISIVAEKVSLDNPTWVNILLNFQFLHFVPHRWSLGSSKYIMAGIYFVQKIGLKGTCYQFLLIPRSLDGNGGNKNFKYWLPVSTSTNWRSSRTIIWYHFRLSIINWMRNICAGPSNFFL